jgi:hypothetical protein
MLRRHGARAPVVTADTDGGAGRTPEPLGQSSGLTARRGRLVLALACFGLFASAGTASAYWSATGSGSSAASTGTLSGVSVVAFIAGDAPGTSLLPGGTSDVMLRVTNANGYPVTLTAISTNGSITAVGGTGTCTTTGVSTNFPSNPSIVVLAGSHLIDMVGAASMSLTSMNGCQGAAFHIPVSATFQK